MSEIELKDCECHGCLKYGAEAHGLTFHNEKVVLDFVADREAGLVSALEHYAGDLTMGCSYGESVAREALKEYRGER